MKKISRLVILAAAVAVSSLFIANLTGNYADWLNPRYLYRYFVWNQADLIFGKHDYQRFPYHLIQPGDSTFHFVLGTANSMPQKIRYTERGITRERDLTEFLAATHTTAFIVVQDDKLLYERYFNGHLRSSICTSYSMAKSFTSALIGIAIDEGAIQSVEDPVTKYLPDLQRRGFRSTTVKHLLTMESGVHYVERYLFGIGFGFPWDDNPKAYLFPYLTQLPAKMYLTEPPGRSWLYNDYNVLLLGMILKRVTRKSPADYLQEKLWKPIGMEYSASWSTDSEEDDFELMQAGLNATAIDYAKFGRLFLNGGNWNGKKVVSSQWVIESTTPQSDNIPWRVDADWKQMGGWYGYLWWGLSQGSEYAFIASGLGGQFIYVQPARHIVIVRTGTEPGINMLEWPSVFRSIANRVE